MKKYFTWMSFFLLSSFAVEAGPKLPPPDMKKFDQKCPAPKLCRKLERLRDGCLLNQAECDSFVDVYDQMLSYSDCTGTPPTEKNKQLVPAFWLCERLHMPLTYSALQKVTSLKGQKLYGSQKFRDGLAGPVAGSHWGPSMALEAKLRKAGH